MANIYNDLVAKIIDEMVAENELTEAEARHINGSIDGGDVVNHPNHYTGKAIECIDIIGVMTGNNFKGFLKGNVIKYLYRYEDKNGVEDLKKAQWYLNKLIAVEEAQKG